MPGILSGGTWHSQRLKDRYGSRLELWEYKPEYYLRARSAENLPEETISPERMKKLDKLKDAELVKIADLIRPVRKGCVSGDDAGMGV